MIPSRFPEATCCLAKPPGMSDDECGSLWVHRNPVEYTTLSCWRMSWRERISALLFGRVWIWVHAGGMTQPPIALLASRNVFTTPRRD